MYIIITVMIANIVYWYLWCVYDNVMCVSFNGNILLLCASVLFTPVVPL